MQGARLTLVAAADAIARGDISSVELTREMLARAQRLNATLNCFIRIDEEAALAAAAAADAARAAGRPLGPLHGVPIAVKDMYYDADRVSNCGSQVRRGYRPGATGGALARVYAAGAVNLGVLNMTEFALGPTGHNAFYGHCRNPWNPVHIAGGSSSGSGASARRAARVRHARVGHRRLDPPARRGQRRAGHEGDLRARDARRRDAFSPWMDHLGPLARTARDCARLLRVLAGHDPADVTTSRRAVPDYEAGLGRGIDGLRIGVPRNYYWDGVTADVHAALQAALRALEAGGARIVELEVPAPGHLTELSRAVVYAEAAAQHGHWLRTRAQEYSPQVRARAATGAAIPAASYLEALQLRPLLLRRFVEGVYAQCDVLFTPTLVIPVPTLEETDVGGSAAMWNVIARLVQCTAPFNYLGVPALAVPAGFAGNGLPVSFQLVGRPFAEGLLLRVAAAYQGMTDWHERLPPVA
ncbi:MAG: amidase [Steroidobacteraceae bacterium]